MVRFHLGYGSNSFIRLLLQFFGMVCPVAKTTDCKSVTLVVNIVGSTPSHPIKSHTGKQSCVNMKDIRLGE